MSLSLHEIKPLVFLAPLAGYTDAPFRFLAHQLGCPASVTEMISSEGLVRNNKKTAIMLKIHPDEGSVLVQLFGTKPDTMAEAARHCEGLGFSAIDINMGCPMRKIVNGGAGAALMGEPKLAATLVEAVSRAVSLPVTVKLRSGWDEATQNVEDMARRMQDAGAQMLFLHPRTRSQFFTGKSDWRWIEKVARLLRIPVVGNGDIQSPQDALRMVQDCGCAGVMVGRAAMGNPWLLGNIARAMTGEQQLSGQLPPAQERVRVFALHLQAMVDWHQDEHQAVLKMRKHGALYLRGLRGATRIRKALVQANSQQQMLDCMQQAA